MKGDKNFSQNTQEIPKKTEKKKRKGSRERKETMNAVASLALVMLVKRLQQ